MHLIPISKALAEYDSVEVNIFVTTQEERDLCAEILAKLCVDKYTVSILRVNRILRRISPKLAILFSNMKTFKRLDVLIVAERTSTILRYVSRRLPHFIHIPHGAGDRAKSYDPRIRHFDHVLVAGEKDKRRMVALGLVTDATCHVTGYIKPYAVKQMGFDRPKLFDNEQPTILYNPHFSPKLTSWTRFGIPLLETFSKMQGMNFIVAPHMRLFKNTSAGDRQKIEAYAKFANIHVDLGSEASTNMTYTSDADIYLGDVSSQVYEFLSRPKPCIFMDAYQTPWEDNPDYAHWHYGKVCRSPDEAISALKSAQDDHHKFKDIQVSGCFAATGDPEWDPISRAAEAVMVIAG